MEILTPLEKDVDTLPNGARLHIKHEGELEAGSFKQRGMTRAVEMHPDDEVFCLASAGGAAAALALAVQKAGKRAEIFVPTSTPEVKKVRVRMLGGDAVRLTEIDAVFPLVQQIAAESAADNGWRLQSAYDDQDVIDGHADVAREVLSQTPEASERIHFVPVGGGSLLAGTLLATEQAGDRVVGVQFSTNTSLAQSLAANERQVARSLDTLAEGSAANIGVHNFKIIQKHQDRLETIIVTPQELGKMVIRECMRHYAEYESPYFPNLIESPYRRAEATGLLAEAGAHRYAATHGAETHVPWIAYQTGSNADESRLQELADCARRAAKPMKSTRNRTWHGPHTNC